MAQDEEESLQQDVQPMPNTEASDLRELHLSANFLTPYAVAPTHDNKVWLTNTQQAYVNHNNKVRLLHSDYAAKATHCMCITKINRARRRLYSVRAIASLAMAGYTLKAS